jgi:hypothetical protein
MTTSSFMMNRLSIASFILVITTTILFSSCKKDDHHPNHPPAHSSEVLDKWMTLQIRLMRNATGTPNHGFARHYAYTGVAAMEALAPVFTNKSWRSKWNGLTGLPNHQGWKKYYMPANVNAAMAAINRSFFSNANAADKAAIDSLENALNASFLSNQSQDLINTSADFGKAVATAVFNWAETDGYKNANNPYVVPTGPGLWKPAPGAGPQTATPYWGQNRTVITGSTANTDAAAPVAYSTEPGSSFYNMVKEVYDVSQTLTDDQKAMAIFWRDVPGATSPGHWLSILQQTIRKKGTDLYKTAVAYALTGIAINDALITCFKSKYQYNLVRPVTYIREVMGHSSWNSFIGTPAHPEYVSAHSSLSAAAAEVMEKLFGNIGSFTDHTYDYLGMQPRTYSSFTAIGAEAGLSRLYAGIHYRASIDAGLQQGRKVAANILSSHH